MTEETNLVVHKAKPAKSLNAMFAKVRGLDANSKLNKISAVGVPRFTVDSNKFIIKHGGNEQTLKDGKKPAKSVMVCIHDWSFDIQRQLAEPWVKDKGFRGRGCWSNNGNSPDEGVWNKQSEDCDTCPVKMECKMSRNLVISLYSPTDEPEHPMIFTTNWSSNSKKKQGDDMDEMLFGLINYLNFLKGHNVEPYKLITELVIDDWSDNTPANNCKVLFRPIDGIPEDGPNRVAHEKWLAEEADRFEKMLEIKQLPPEDDTVGDSAGAGEEDDTEAEDEAAAKKAAAAAKRKEAAAAKKEKEEEARKASEAEEEEVDLDDLGEEEEEEETEADDGIDMSELDELMGDIKL